MIFAPPRFIVVDDKKDHLRSIVEAFEKLGTACMGVLYDSETPPDPEWFRRVRVLFLDIHLISSVPATTSDQHFGLIADMLESYISEDGGPFLLVIWTEHENLAQQLIEYLDDALSEKPQARPLAIAPFSKNTFINVDSGDAHDLLALRDKIVSVISDVPQLGSLLTWENDALMATSSTLSSVVDLVPTSMRKSETFAPELDNVLSLLAEKAVGRPHALTDPRTAIMSVLAPILEDKIVNRTVSAEVEEIWKRSITKVPSPTPDASVAGKVNRMIHVALPSPEIISPSDWGAVMAFPKKWCTKCELKRRFDVTINQLLGDEFKLRKDDRKPNRLRLIRVGAVCDHAQRRAGPIPFLLGVEIPEGIERIEDSSGAFRPPAAEWSSPVLVVAEENGPFELVINARYQVNLTADEVKKWTALYRLREQLLMQVIVHASTYHSRPGIMNL